MENINIPKKTGLGPVFLCEHNPLKSGKYTRKDFSAHVWYTLWY